MRRHTLAGIVLLALALSVNAQVIVNNASTVAESQARGISEIVRARGQYELDSAEARVTRTEAASRELDNRMKATETYFERRNYNREQRFGTPEEKYERRRANQERYASYARSASPRELSDAELDPLTGKITWKLVLRSPKYDGYRQKLDYLFAQRARQEGKISYETYEQIRNTSKEFLVALRKNVADMDVDQYRDAKRFVNSLIHQAELSG